MVTDNPVINEPRYFNIFESGKNHLNSIDATCERACMETSKDKYYTEMYNNLTDYNLRNNKPLYNANIRETIGKFMEEESITDAKNVNADIFNHASNAQRENNMLYLQVRS